MAGQDDASLIAKLLQSTGLSCEDLLSKLQQYKTCSKTDEPQTDDNKSVESSGESFQVSSSLETEDVSSSTDETGPKNDANPPDTVIETQNTTSILPITDQSEIADKEEQLTIDSSVENSEPNLVRLEDSSEPSHPHSDLADGETINVNTEPTSTSSDVTTVPNLESKEKCTPPKKVNNVWRQSSPPDGEVIISSDEDEVATTSTNIRRKTNSSFIARLYEKVSSRCLQQSDDEEAAEKLSIEDEAELTTTIKSVNDLSCSEPLPATDDLPENCSELPNTVLQEIEASNDNEVPKSTSEEASKEPEERSLPSPYTDSEYLDFSDTESKKTDTAKSLVVYECTDSSSSEGNFRSSTLDEKNEQTPCEEPNGAENKEENLQNVETKCTEKQKIDSPNLEEVKTSKTDQEVVKSSDGTSKDLSAIECQPSTSTGLTHADHDYSTADMEVAKSEEKLRDVLRKQLHSLRTMKKPKTCLPDLQRRSPLPTSYNTRKKRRSAEVKTLQGVDVKENSQTTEPIAGPSSGNSLISQTDETEFLILDVTGGVDRLLEEKEKSPERSLASISESTTEATPGTSNQEPTQDCTIQELVPKITIRKDVANEAFSQDSGVEKSHSDEKSPFVSDSLDNFLSDSARLQVSYVIPKLRAEEGISEKTKQQSPYDDLMVPVGSLPYNPAEQTMKERKAFKVKTLAEMRRLYEKNQKLQQATKVPGEEKEPPIASKRNNFVIFDKKKLRVLSRQADRQYATIEKYKVERKRRLSAQKTPPARKLELPSPRRPSLLSTLTQKTPVKVNYKPGPLSKKFRLQNTESTCEWQTEIKAMPRIYLEVEPEFGKRFDPHILHLLPTSTTQEIDAERAEFALTALKVKNSEPTQKSSYTFVVPYQNHQNRIVVRRKKEKPPAIQSISFSEPCEVKASANDIEYVINDLIRYVETKELEHTIFKKDDTEVALQDEPLDSAKAPVSTYKAKGGQPKKMKRLECELRRLNCMVINVSSEKGEKTNCKKPHCKMGCVCQTQSRNAVYTTHCQLVDCMFQCTCVPRLRARKIVSNNAALSEQTLNHINDQAKQNLAKEERDFTQTLIHTDDDVILVGSGSRDKFRRSTKTPKKYSDFYKPHEDWFEDFKRAKEQEKTVKKCTVDVTRLDIDGLVPFCMYHKNHDCFCKGEVGTTVRRKYKTAIRELNMKNQAAVKEANAKAQTAVKETSSKGQAKETYSKRSTENAANPEKVAPIVSVISLKGFKNHDHSARTRAVFRQYIERNKTPLYNQNLLKKASWSASLLKHYLSKDFEQEQTFVSLANTTGGSVKIRHGQVVSEKKGSKRKQNFEVRREIDEQEEQLPPQKVRKSRQHHLAEKFYQPVFDGEIKVSLKQENHELLEIIGKEYSSLEYLRIIHWNRLIKGFRNMKISIWCKENRAGILLCNSAEHSAPNSFENILEAEQRPEIAEWILKDQLPPNIPRALMHLILTPKFGHYLIAGYCLKTIPNTQPEEVDESRTNFGEVKTNDKTTGPSVSEEDEIIIVDEPSEEPREEPSEEPREASEEPREEPSVEQSEKPATPEAESNQRPKRTPKPKTPFEEVGPTPKKTKKQPEATTNIEPDKKSTLLNQFIHTQEVPNELQMNLKAPSKSLKCAHKDMFNENKVLVLTNRNYIPRILHLDRDTDNKVELPLPSVPTQCKWLMVFLQSDFSFLSFCLNTYSIKYNDLMDVVKLANNVNTTITLRNREFGSKFKHPQFAVYCVPNYNDRIIIGPYMGKEMSNISTWRYLHGNLIDTNVFNAMAGKKHVKNYQWVWENGRGAPEVIDITQEEDPASQRHEIFQKSLLCKPFVEILTPEEVKSKWVNRYILTNIPHLGYLEARQLDSTAIEIFWPVGNKGYRFPHVTFAKHCLIQYFSQIFYAVPKDFKICVVILTKLNLTRYKLVDEKFFKLPLQGGPYVCGEFGIDSAWNVSKELLSKNNISSPDELYSIEHLEQIEDNMVKLFGMYLMTNEQFHKCGDYEEILGWAMAEIKTLELSNKIYHNVRSNVKEEIRENRMLLQRLQDSLGTCTITKIPAANTSETIEISDSDTEETAKQSTPLLTLPKLVPLAPLVPASNSSPRSLLKSNQLPTTLRKMVITKEMPDPKTDKPKKIIIIKQNLLLDTAIHK